MTSDIECEFCRELTPGLEDRFGELVGGARASRMVYQIGQLRVFPSLGEIVQGHLLVAPTYHVTSMVNLTEQDLRSLALLIERIRRVYLSIHGQVPVFFEHGDPTGKEMSYGQCVSHAHLHVLPKPVDMLSRLRAERRFILTTEIGAPKEIKEPYVSFTDQELRTHVFSSANAPRQYMRALYCELIDDPAGYEWWRRIDLPTTLASAQKYRTAFELAEKMNDWQRA